MKFVLGMFVVVFYLLTLLPSVQFVFEPIPKKRLNGLTVRRDKPELTTDTVLSGQFQRKLERWFTQNSGLWGYFVRTENEINVALFKQVSQSYKSKVILGKDNVLYQREYIDDYNRINLVSPERLKRLAGAIKQLQLKLAERGVTFLLVISPSKVALDPAGLPASYARPQMFSKPRDYQTFVAFLLEEKVRFVDGHRYFVERKSEYQHGVFAKSAAHWNDVATCNFTSQVLRELEDEMNRALVAYTCEPIKIKPIPKATDRDLAEIVNVWREARFYEDTPYPLTERIKKDDVYQPRVLFVGTSFLWSILRYWDYHKVYKVRDMYYYYMTNHHYPSGAKRPIDRARLDWEREVLSHDVIIVEVNETMVERAGFGFIEDALKFLG